MDKKVAVGVIGLGTVGSGVVKTLENFENIIIKRIADKDESKRLEFPELADGIFTTNSESIVNDPEIQIVVESIGGINAAFNLVKAAILNGKHIVTPNKELIAKCGRELFELAKEKNVVILYEAAVGGGIPIIMPLKQSLAGNKISKIAGILNGTTNYILTKMENEDSEFETVLKEAQNLGYAEADPSGDVQGHDAANKIAILASLGFNKRIDVNQIYREGIDKISPVDIDYAAEFGYKIKLIGLAQEGINGTIDARVHPMLVSKTYPLAHINDVLNAIVVEGEPVSKVMFSGPGAGKFPTASSVAGDVLAIAYELDVTDFPLPMMRCTHKEDAELLDINETKNKYYIRISTANTPGVIGDLGLICGSNNINLNSVIQKGLFENNSARIVLLTDLAYEKDIRKALKEISERPSVEKIENVLRVME